MTDEEQTDNNTGGDADDNIEASAENAIDERLITSTWPVVELETCEVRLSREWSYPGRCLVIPTMEFRDIHEVPGEDFLLMMGEVRFVTGVLAKLYGANKMNVASFGNMVPWLHWHIIPRLEGDAGWPGTPWENPNAPVEADDETLADHADHISWALLDAEFEDGDEGEEMA